MNQLKQKKLEELPLEYRQREFPPGFLDDDPAARKELISLVRELQKRVRLAVRTLLLTNMVDGDGNMIDHGIVPNLHDLTDSIFHSLHHAPDMCHDAEIKEIKSMKYVARIGHLRLHTLDHLMNPSVKKVSQWKLIDNMILHLKSKSSDY